MCIRDSKYILGRLFVETPVHLDIGGPASIETVRKYELSNKYSRVFVHDVNIKVCEMFVTDIFSFSSVT